MYLERIRLPLVPSFVRSSCCRRPYYPELTYFGSKIKIFKGPKSAKWAFKVGQRVPKKGLFQKSGNFPINWVSWARYCRPKRRKRRYLVWAIDVDRIRVLGFLPFIYMIYRKIAIFWVFFEKMHFLGDQKPGLVGGPWGAEKGAFLEIWEFSPTLGCLGVPLAHLPPPLLEIDL